MADWRQIRARIRRAKAGPDAATRLEQLFEKTRDGMVAFELAQLEEVAGQIERATKWYHHAWDRFRRAEWRKRAEEALGRLGAPIPTDSGPEETPQEEHPPELTPVPVDFTPQAEIEPQASPEPEREARAGAAQPPPGPAGGE
ncbi:MAG TPA: hypothetical protein VGS20_05745, partial [Candidatus Acidoferrales bacterium]|nr:hypothetical protein [Candidatus Acidoferrales bacterium]